ncbi:MAG: hypothetical protein OHK0039_30070 [Bacteroidia bacterium]
MNKLVFAIMLGVLFCASPTKANAQLVEGFTLISTGLNIYDKGKEFLEDLGLSWWGREGFLSLVTDRSQGVRVYIGEQELTTVYPHRHANYKVKEGTYKVVAQDNQNRRKQWVEVVTIRDDEITELTLTKDGWVRRSRKR